MSVAAGGDGRLRCSWALSTPDYVAYHDDEWGRPVRDDTALFEKMSLEAFQSGLSWLTILRKRTAFRAAFAGFDAEKVAAFGPADRVRLLDDVGIVRNRAKVDATIANAAAVLDLGPHGLTTLIWSFAPDKHIAPVVSGDVPASSPESKALAAALKKSGFRFVGPTTAYALMQACGLVNDHFQDCEFR